MFGLHLVLVRLLEWLTLFPDCPDLLQIVQVAIFFDAFNSYVYNKLALTYTNLG